MALTRPAARRCPTRRRRVGRAPVPDVAGGALPVRAAQERQGARAGQVARHLSRRGLRQHAQGAAGWRAQDPLQDWHLAAL
eukprot:6052922-Prymnesium_polylepis.1